MWWNLWVVCRWLKICKCCCKRRNFGLCLKIRFGGVTSPRWWTRSLLTLLPLTGRLIWGTFCSSLSVDLGRVLIRPDLQFTWKIEISCPAGCQALDQMVSWMTESKVLAHSWPALNLISLPPFLLLADYVTFPICSTSLGLNFPCLKIGTLTKQSEYVSPWKLGQYLDGGSPWD